MLLTLAVVSPGSAARDWPPFLRGSDAYPAHIAAAVRRLWVDATFTRTVSAEPVPVPLAFYLRFVDTPDLTAAAARHLGLTTYDVRVLGGDWYEADDGNRTHGVYHVLVRDGARRVVVSWGTHSGSILGTIGGSALTRLEFAEAQGGATQRLVVNAIVDNGLVAGMTRPVLLLFGWLVDRKLGEAFRTAATVAEWAHATPDAFCAWLDATVANERRGEILKVFGECVEADRTRQGQVSGAAVGVVTAADHRVATLWRLHGPAREDDGGGSADVRPDRRDPVRRWPARGGDPELLAS